MGVVTLSGVIVLVVDLLIKPGCEKVEFSAWALAGSGLVTMELCLGRTQ